MRLEKRKTWIFLITLSILVVIPGIVISQENESSSDQAVSQDVTEKEKTTQKTRAETSPADTSQGSSSSVTINDLFFSLLIVAAALFAAFLIHRLFTWLGEVARTSRFNIDGIVLKIIGPPVSVLVATFPILYAMRRIPAIQERFNRWAGAEKALLILVGTWVLSSLVKKLINHYGLPLANRTDTTIDERLVHILDLTAVYIIWALGILVALRTVGIKVTAFLASMGIAGLAVALAAKTVLSNMLGGITLTADPYLNLGDRIEVREFVGDVVNINLYKTTIRTRDNKIVSIPNDILVKEVVINHELPESRTRLSLSFGVSYDSDIEDVTEVVNEVVEEDDRILDEPEPEVNLQEFASSSVNFNLLVWLDSPRRRRNVRDTIYRQIFKRFRERDIEIPFPQRVIHQSK